MYILFLDLSITKTLAAANQSISDSNRLYRLDQLRSKSEDGTTTYNNTGLTAG